MAEDEKIPTHTRLQRVLEFLTILGIAIAGMARAPAWIAVPLATVVLLWVSTVGCTSSERRWCVPIGSRSALSSG